MWQTKTIVSTVAVPMDIKTGRMVTYLERLLPTKSHDPSITCSSTSCDKLKPLYLHYNNAYRHQIWQDVSYLQSYLTFWSRDLARQRN